MCVQTAWGIGCESCVLLVVSAVLAEELGWWDRAGRNVVDEVPAKAQSRREMGPPEGGQEGVGALQERERGGKDE